jgi:hypothetical protein
MQQTKFGHRLSVPEYGPSSALSFKILDFDKVEFNIQTMNNAPKADRTWIKRRDTKAVGMNLI